MSKNFSDIVEEVKDKFNSPGSHPIYPLELQWEDSKVKFHGLNKREYFALIAMQSLINNVNYSLDAVAELSVEMSDKMLKELDKK